MINEYVFVLFFIDINIKSLLFTIYKNTSGTISIGGVGQKGNVHLRFGETDYDLKR